MKRSPRQRSTARISAPNMRCNTGFSPKSLATIFRHPALLDEQPFDQVSRSRHAPMGDGQTEVGDARLEIVVKAGRARPTRSRRSRRGCRSPARARSLATAPGSRRRRASNSRHRSAETLMARLRMRWARQRWRAERGKPSSIARMESHKIAEVKHCVTVLWPRGERRGYLSKC